VQTSQKTIRMTLVLLFAGNLAVDLDFLTLQRLALLSVSKAHTNKLYICQQCMYIVI